MYPTGRQLSGQDPLRPRRDHDRHGGLDGEPLGSGARGLNGPRVNSRAVPVSLSAEASGQPLPLLNISPTDEQSLALAAAIAQANGLVLQPDPNSHCAPSPIAPTTHSHINPVPEYPSPPNSDHLSLYPSGVSAAIQEALDSLHPPQASPQHLRIAGGSPFTIPASLPTTPVLIASFPTTPSAPTQSIHPMATPGDDVCPSPMPVPAGQSPYLQNRLVASGVALNVDLYPQRSASPSREPRDDEGLQMGLNVEFAVLHHPEDDIVQVEPLEVYRLPLPSTMPSSPRNTVSSRPSTQPLATKSSKGHHLELDISGLARRFTSSSQKSSTKSLSSSHAPSAVSTSTNSLLTAPISVVEPSTHTSAESSGISPHRLLRKAQSHSRLRDTPTSLQSSSSWIGGNSSGSGGSSRLPGLPRQRKSFQNLPPLPVPVPTISSSLPGLPTASSLNYSTTSGQSGSPPEDKSKGKEKVEKEKATSPRKRFFNSSKYSSGNSSVLEKEYAGLIGKTHEAEASLPMQHHQSSPRVEIPSLTDMQGLPLRRPQLSRPRSAPSQRMNSPPPSRSPPPAPPMSTPPPKGQAAALEDEWASHFSSPLRVSGLIIHEAAASPRLGTSGAVPDKSPPLSKHSSEENTSSSIQDSPTMSVSSLKTEERRVARRHIIPPSELLRLGEEAREHTSALQSPPGLSRARPAWASFEYPAMSGFAPNGTPVGFAALRARSTSTSRLPSSSATLASPILGPNGTRSQRSGSTGTSMTIPMLSKPLGAYPSRSISSGTFDLGGTAPTRSLSVLSKASSPQSSCATKARRPSTAGSLNISTSLSPFVGFACPNGGTKSLPPPPRPRLPSLRMGRSTVGYSSSARTSTSTEFISPISNLTSAPTRSSGASWGRTTSSPNISRPPSSASLSHPPVHSSGAGIVAAASQRQRSVLKKPSFLDIGDEDDDARINGPEGDISVTRRPQISRANTNATSRTNSSQSSSGGRSRAPSFTSGRSVHRVPSKASLQAPQPPVSVIQSDSFLDLDMGSISMGTIRQHPDELEFGEDERVLGYRY